MCVPLHLYVFLFFFFQAEDCRRDTSVTGVQTCALPIYPMCAIPNDLREDVQNDLGLILSGTLSPYMAVVLKEKYDGDFLKLPVKRITMDEMQRDRKSVV